jgi:hypothetical protein
MRQSRASSERDTGACRLAIAASVSSAAATDWMPREGVGRRAGFVIAVS